MAQKEPLIERKERPTAVDYEAAIKDWRVRDLLAVIDARIAELIKPEKELLKPEKELLKPPEKEFFKPPEKEFLKPEKEYSKPEKEAQIPMEERVAKLVVEMLEKRGLFK